MQNISDKNFHYMLDGFAFVGLRPESLAEKVVSTDSRIERFRTTMPHAEVMDVASTQVYDYLRAALQVVCPRALGAMADGELKQFSARLVEEAEEDYGFTAKEAECDSMYEARSLGNAESGAGMECIHELRSLNTYGE